MYSARWRPEAQRRFGSGSPVPSFSISCSRCSAPRGAGNGRACYWTSVAALAIFVGLGLYSGACLARSRLRAEMLPHPQRVPRDRGGHAGLSQHLRREVHIALAAQAERTATMEDRLRLARDLHDGLLPSLTGTALQLETAGRRVETDPHRGWKPDPSKGCSRPSNGPSGLSSGNWSRTGRRRQGWPPR